ncbi:kinesin motor domain-containing protein [Toxoplasma gondii GAB2-2007-GAL-DOM2]|uniref:Kinesin motor domain-containing protein n=4 Tax=Toxoplasma gondii TaxID=5811 RepID=S7WKH6_TOXGG|nr:kinesin motor domain-containing protein [Toxoplasma gondii GT1]KAF4642302.1 kinesin motor domain-containing protein [Toxoplasma gondii]KFG43747.1 kinesin motor domain-containing protein [Toxoplasma gondii GAB2-2007-GAL-DOM2]KFG54413.1 kinesin motor domain-containing protein [Toxoplasma gondii FOU]
MPTGNTLSACSDSTLSRPSVVPCVPCSLGPRRRSGSTTDRLAATRCHLVSPIQVIRGRDRRRTSVPAGRFNGGQSDGNYTSEDGYSRRASSQGAGIKKPSNAGAADERCVTSGFSAENVGGSERNISDKRVVVRIRGVGPRSSRNLALCVHPEDNTRVICHRGTCLQEFRFSRVFADPESNDDIYHEIGGPQIVEAIGLGVKETVLAYGQTGIEIFGEALYDLLPECETDRRTGAPLIVRHEECFIKTSKFTYKVCTVDDEQTALDLLEDARQQRRVGDSHLNSRSSRSHAVVQFFVHTRVSEGRASELLKRPVIPERPVGECAFYGVLTLVDLAGCEREAPSYLPRRLYTGNGYKDESKAGCCSRSLNASISTLNRLIRKMQTSTLDESDRRQSALNRVLFDYLQPECGVCMIFCLNPEASELQVSLSTLSIASESRLIPCWRRQYFLPLGPLREYYNESVICQSVNPISDLIKARHPTVSQDTGSFLSSSSSHCSNAVDSAVRGRPSSVGIRPSQQSKHKVEVEGRRPGVTSDDLFPVSSSDPPDASPLKPRQRRASDIPVCSSPPSSPLGTEESTQSSGSGSNAWVVKMRSQSSSSFQLPCCPRRKNMGTQTNSSGASHPISDIGAGGQKVVSAVPSEALGAPPCSGVLHVSVLNAASLEEILRNARAFTPDVLQRALEQQGRRCELRAHSDGTKGDKISTDTGRVIRHLSEAQAIPVQLGSNAGTNMYLLVPASSNAMSATQRGGAKQSGCEGRFSRGSTDGDPGNDVSSCVVESDISSVDSCSLAPKARHSSQSSSSINSSNAFPVTEATPESSLTPRLSRPVTETNIEQCTSSPLLPSLCSGSNNISLRSASDEGMSLKLSLFAGVSEGVNTETQPVQGPAAVTGTAVKSAHRDNRSPCFSFVKNKPIVNSDEGVPCGGPAEQRTSSCERQLVGSEWEQRDQTSEPLGIHKAKVIGRLQQSPCSMGYVMPQRTRDLPFPTFTAPAGCSGQRPHATVSDHVAETAEKHPVGPLSAAPRPPFQCCCVRQHKELWRDIELRKEQQRREERRIQAQIDLIENQLLSLAHQPGPSWTFVPSRLHRPESRLESLNESSAANTCTVDTLLLAHRLLLNSYRCTTAATSPVCPACEGPGGCPELPKRRSFSSLSKNGAATEQQRTLLSRRMDHGAGVEHACEETAADSTYQPISSAGIRGSHRQQATSCVQHALTVSENDAQDQRSKPHHVAHRGLSEFHATNDGASIGGVTGGHQHRQVSDEFLPGTSEGDLLFSSNPGSTFRSPCEAETSDNVENYLGEIGRNL